MAPVALNELFTFILAILAILLGIAMNARSAALRASNIPPSLVITSRGPRTQAVISAGSTCTWPRALRALTAIALTDHS